MSTKTVIKQRDMVNKIIFHHEKAELARESKKCVVTYLVMISNLTVVSA